MVCGCVAFRAHYQLHGSKQMLPCSWCPFLLSFPASAMSSTHISIRLKYLPPTGKRDSGLCWSDVIVWVQGSMCLPTACGPSTPPCLPKTMLEFFNLKTSQTFQRFCWKGHFKMEAMHVYCNWRNMYKTKSKEFQWPSLIHFQQLLTKGLERACPWPGLRSGLLHPSCTFELPGLLQTGPVPDSAQGQSSGGEGWTSELQRTAQMLPDDTEPLAETNQPGFKLKRVNDLSLGTYNMKNENRRKKKESTSFSLYLFTHLSVNHVIHCYWKPTWLWNDDHSS